MPEYLSENLDAENIACYPGISRSKLYMTCSKYLGMGIAEYVRDLRLEEAKNLLKAADWSITEIAERVGFENYNYFSRVFKIESRFAGFSRCRASAQADSFLWRGMRILPEGFCPIGKFGELSYWTKKRPGIPQGNTAISFDNSSS